ncbi:MAG: hypothetical protein J6W80_02485 [Kiritimatiellae bacterium]|nr:hypothetical protein [Kiritimatiellia bacterium]
MGDDNNFVSFLCGGCHTEIEATVDMIGETTECPACGVKLVVPDTRDPSDGVVRHTDSSPANDARSQAMKGRTIRIELGDL